MARIVLPRALFKHHHGESGFRAIAKAYGIASRAVEKREELDDAIAEMLNHDGAYVLVANVETCGMVYPMVPAGGSVTNMIMGDEK